VAPKYPGVPPIDAVETAYHTRVMQCRAATEPSHPSRDLGVYQAALRFRIRQPGAAQPGTAPSREVVIRTTGKQSVDGRKCPERQFFANLYKLARGVLPGHRAPRSTSAHPDAGDVNMLVTVLASPSRPSLQALCGHSTVGWTSLLCSGFGKVIEYAGHTHRVDARRLIAADLGCTRSRRTLEIAWAVVAIRATGRHSARVHHRGVVLQSRAGSPNRPAHQTARRGLLADVTRPVTRVLPPGLIPRTSICQLPLGSQVFLS
jgi:hypothetical protein